jgi:RNA polymerase sigma-70 factor, ECF subfamily
MATCPREGCICLLTLLTPLTPQFGRTCSFFSRRPQPWVLLTAVKGAGLSPREAVTAETLASLYRRYGAIIHARCLRLLRDEAEAEDATQETFLRLHRHLHRLSDDQDILRWIYRVATNYCFNELRNRKRRPAPVATLPERAADAAASDQRIADRQLVLHLLERMPEKVKTAAWLYHADGFEQEEVATILGVSLRTVATRLALFSEKVQKLRSQARARGE